MTKGIRRLVLAALVVGSSSSFVLADRDDADDLLKQYENAYNRGDAAALADLYAEDGLLLPPDRPMVRGRAAIERVWKSAMGSGLKLSVVERGVGSDTGYLIGKFSFPGNTQAGKFVVCVKRDNQGRWRIAADIWNNDAVPRGLQPAEKKNE
jgi:ketosteroid isomerase-like protein